MNIKQQLEQYKPYNPQEVKDREIMLRYMDTFDDKKLYELEGDDTYLFKLASDSCVIKIPKRIKVSKQSIKQNEVGKIYQFKKIGGDKNDKY